MCAIRICVPDEGRDWLAGIEDGVAGLRVGVLRRPGFDAPVDTDGIAAVERAAALLAEAGAIVEEAIPQLPDTREVFSRVWGATLARLVANTPQQQRDWLDPGILEVARALGSMSAIEYLDAEAMRSAAAHAMARLHQTFRPGAVPDCARSTSARRRTAGPIQSPRCGRDGRRGPSPSTSRANRR